MPDPVFTGNENHDITLSDAAAMTRNYRTNHPGKTLGGFFGRAAIERILAQPGVVGIRYYFAYETGSNVLRLVLTGALANRNDLHTGRLAEISIVCPDICGINNPLNSDQ